MPTLQQLYAAVPAGENTTTYDQNGQPIYTPAANLFDAGKALGMNSAQVVQLLKDAGSPNGVNQYKAAVQSGLIPQNYVDPSTFSDPSSTKTPLEQMMKSQFPAAYNYITQAMAKTGVTGPLAFDQMASDIYNSVQGEQSTPITAPINTNQWGSASQYLNSAVTGLGSTFKFDPNTGTIPANVLLTNNPSGGDPTSLASGYAVARPDLFQGDQTGIISSLKAFATEGVMSTPIAQIALSIATSGLAYEVQLAISAAMTIARGGNVQDVIKSAVGSLAANELSGFVKGLENITDPTVKTALANSVSAATKALATGGDVGQALVAGAAGGAIAAETQSATDSNAIARAAGEYAKALAAGQSQQQALTGALSGFISQQDKATAAPLIQAEAAKITSEPPSGADVVATPFEPSGSPISSDQVTALPEQPVISSSDTSQLPSGARFATPEDIAAAKNKFGGGSDATTPTLLPEVPVTSERDSQIMDLTGITSSDAPSSAATPSTPAAAKKDIIMLSGTGAGTPDAGSITPTSVSTGGQAPPGSQALAQALRTGDVGDPLFGRKGKSNRPVWNVESLRTKDETGA